MNKICHDLLERREAMAVLSPRRPQNSSPVRGAWEQPGIRTTCHKKLTGKFVAVYGKASRDLPSTLVSQGIVTEALEDAEAGDKGLKERNWG
jgi:hypothetical protein